MSKKARVEKLARVQMRKRRKEKESHPLNECAVYRLYTRLEIHDSAEYPRWICERTEKSLVLSREMKMRGVKSISEGTAMPRLAEGATCRVY